MDDVSSHGGGLFEPCGTGGRFRAQVIKNGRSESSRELDCSRDLRSTRTSGSVWHGPEEHRGDEQGGRESRRAITPPVALLNRRGQMGDRPRNGAKGRRHIVSPDSGTTPRFQGSGGSSTSGGSAFGREIIARRRLGSQTSSTIF